ncbi:uroporphyrinogen-III C-methyltransferase, partial [Burkholderia multivorans]|uniref:uroporphyrinogen-III C-methyltransferase n=1 Tax=Burkholderia multivorans TaxID=87883 RepID=UPI00215F3999
IIDVGKTPGHHPVPQQRINEILVEQARAGRRVVRLKGGDPFVFGRGSEELAHLREAGIVAQVVPGVTSANSVPAVAGIPLTHRSLATTYTVVTGHDQLSDLGGGRDHTVVVLMGIGTLTHSAMVLARGDRGGDCPVAIIEDGYGKNQRVTVGTLNTIAFQAAHRGVRSPAVVIVGDAELVVVLVLNVVGLRILDIVEELEGGDLVIRGVDGVFVDLEGVGECHVGGFDARVLVSVAVRGCGEVLPH